ncbi:retrotransposon protein [Cucumis melo var. makuwa]|uniref:Retrotransposon protein n=2 Tax=Cucumis melo TaxID=3656 RepID=A0A5D3CVP7_CUCMM|nr:retrotransposon protein [Cucumis melo var. makuwa]
MLSPMCQVGTRDFNRSQVLNMSSEDMMGAQPNRSSDCRSGSSGLKRKLEEQNVETVDVIRDTMKCVNDLLRAIVDWPKLARQEEDATRREVIRQLQDIPELSRLDRVRYLKIIAGNLVIMKAFLDLFADM